MGHSSNYQFDEEEIARQMRTWNSKLVPQEEEQNTQLYPGQVKKMQILWLYLSRQIHLF